MASKKDTADKADKKKTTKSPVRKTTPKKTAKPKEAAEEMKAAIKENGEEQIKDLSEKLGIEQPQMPNIIDDSDKILKASDVELPAEEPAGKPTIVVSHAKSAMVEKDNEDIEVINAEEVLKDLEYDFDAHEIKPFKGEAMTSHEMHQGKYGVIEDCTKPKKKK